MSSCKGGTAEHPALLNDSSYTVEQDTWWPPQGVQHLHGLQQGKQSQTQLPRIGWSSRSCLRESIAVYETGKEPAAFARRKGGKITQLMALPLLLPQLQQKH